MIARNFILKRKIRNFLTSDNKKTVFFINIKKDLPGVAKILEDCLKIKKRDVLLVFFNAELPVYVKNIDCEKSISEDYLTIQDYDMVDDYTFRGITKNWYQASSELEQQLKYKGINLGSLVEYEFKFFLLPRIKNIEIVNKVMKLHHPSTIVSIDDTGELNPVVKLIVKDSKIHALILSFRYPALMLKAFFRNFRTSITFALSRILDSYMRLKLLKSKITGGCIFIHSRLYDLLFSPGWQGSFTRMIFIKGFLERIRIFRKGEVYLPFYLSVGHVLKKRWRNNWKRIATQYSFRKIFDYKGTLYWDLVEAKLFYFFVECFPRIIKNIDIVYKLHNRVGIKLIVLRTDVREIEETVVMAAKNIDVRTLLVQHGILAEPNGHEVINCDKVAVWGKASTEWYTDIGNSPDKCVVTGNPMFYRLYDRLQTEVKNKNSADSIIRISRYNLHDLINISQLVVNVESTVGLEAVILNKPLLNINLTKRQDLIPYVQRNVALGAYKPDDIHVAMNHILDDDRTKEKLRFGREQFACDYAYKIDKLAGKRVMDLIEQMIKD